MTRERHWPFTTPASKRKFAESMLDNPTHRTTWLALAWLQENGKLEEYHDRRAEWAAKEPRPVDLLPLSEAQPLLDVERAELDRLAREFDAMVAVFRKPE